MILEFLTGGKVAQTKESYSVGDFVFRAVIARVGEKITILFYHILVGPKLAYQKLNRFIFKAY